MHVLATNLVIWIRALVFEGVEGVHHANEDSHEHMASMEDWMTDLSEFSTWEQVITAQWSEFVILLHNGCAAKLWERVFYDDNTAKWLCRELRLTS